MACASGCAEERAAMERAAKAIPAFREKIVSLLKRDYSHHVIQDLLNPPDKKLGSYQNITVTYFDFPIWLSRFDEKMVYGLPVNINSYKYQRNRHIEDVVKELDKFRGKDSGKALLHEIEGTKHVLEIYPYFNFDLYPTALFPPMGLNSTAQGGAKRPGAVGVDAHIMFTPYMWDRDDEPGTAGYHGPGSQADEVLFHEMVHGARKMRGVATKTSVDKNYDDEEEYIAIVLSNIYLAEKKQTDLRASHSDGFARLPQPREFLKNPQHVNMSPAQLLQNFKGAQGAFYEALAHIPEAKAWWNPVRELNGNA